MNSPSDADDYVSVSNTPRDGDVSDWRLLRSSGVWLWLRLHAADQRVIGHAETTLDAATSRAIFTELASGDFFALERGYPPVTVAVEGDILVVTAKLGERRHRVVARPPEHLAPAVALLAERVVTAGSTVASGPPRPRYWRADRLDDGRAARVFSRGLLPRRAWQDVVNADVPALTAALAEPDNWFAVGADEVERADVLADGQPQFLMEGPDARWVLELWRGDG